MPWLSRLCSASLLSASRYKLRCSPYICRTGIRPYSFTDQIQKLLGQFESESSVPPVVPATKEIIAEFHKHVVDPDQTFKYVTNFYEQLKRYSSMHTLPVSTAAVFFKKSLWKRHFGLAVQLLLDYDLHESVLIAGDEMQKLPRSELDFCVFRLFEELQAMGHIGLATQILVELGYIGVDRQTAFADLLMLHEQIPGASAGDLQKLAEGCKRIAERLGPVQEGLRMNPLSALLLVDRALALGQQKFAYDTCKECWYAEDASLRFMIGQSSDIILRLTLSHLENATLHDPSLSLVSRSLRRAMRFIDPQSLRLVSPYILSSANPILEFSLSLRAAGLKDAEDICFAGLSRVEHLRVARIIYAYVKPAHLSSPEEGFSNPHHRQNCLTSFLESLDQNRLEKVISAYLQLIKQENDARYEQYPMRSLFMVLRALDQVKYEIPAHMEDTIRKYMLHRPADELLLFASLSNTRLASLTKIVHHHLRRTREETSELEVVGGNSESTFTEQFSDQTVTTTTRTKYALLAAGDSASSNASFQPPLIDPGVFINLVLQRHEMESKSVSIKEVGPETYGLFVRILKSLVRLPDASLSLSFLTKARKTGVLMKADLGAYVIRELALSDNHDAIYSLLKTYPRASFSYDTYARYISRISEDLPACAMALLKLLVRRKIEPRPRLLQNMMLGISESTSISHGRAFKYLTMLLSISRSVGLPKNRVHLASFMQTVLMRQGLGAATRRIEWLLASSARLTSQITEQYSRQASGGHKDLLEILRKWHIYERSRGLEMRAMNMGPRRPKQLKQLLTNMSKRRSIIGRKARKKQRRKADA